MSRTITLEDWEILNLDQRCSESTQKLIDKLKKKLPSGGELKIPKQVESLPGQKRLFE